MLDAGWSDRSDPPTMYYGGTVVWRPPVFGVLLVRPLLGRPYVLVPGRRRRCVGALAWYRCNLAMQVQAQGRALWLGFGLYLHSYGVFRRFGGGRGAGGRACWALVQLGRRWAMQEQPVVD